MRYPFHGLQMIASYIGQMGPNGRITVAALFQAADEIRRIQRIAYRIRQIQFTYPGFGEVSKSIWQNDPLWQPLREVVEKLLVTYDWGESFVGLNLVLKPIIDDLFMSHFGSFAHHEGDYLIEEILFSLNEDCKWQRELGIQKVRKDGSMLWVREVARAVRDSRGNMAVLIVCEDITKHKRAEALLKESEERFRIMSDTAPVMIWMSGLDKLCTYFNKPWLEFTGRTMEQEMGNGWAEGVHTEDFDRCLETYVRSFDARDGFRMEYRLRRFDGEYRWILDNGTPRFNADGSFAGYIGSCIDITERKKAEAELLRLKDQLAADLDDIRRLQEISTHLVGSGEFHALLEKILDGAIALTKANMGNIQLLDKESCVLRIVVQRGFDRDFLEFFGSVHKGMAACGTALQKKQRVIVKDVANDPIFRGKPACDIMLKAGALAVQTTPLFSRAGDLVGMLSTHYHKPERPTERDLQLLDLLARQAADFIERNWSEEALQRAHSGLEIKIQERTAELSKANVELQRQITERKRVEEEIKKSEAQLSEAQQIAHIGSWEWDITLNKVSWSDELYRIYGLKPQEINLTYGGFLERVHPDDQNFVRRIVKKAYMDHEPFNFDHRIVQPDGIVRILHARGRVIVDEAGHAVRMIGTGQDITERKQVEEEIRKLSEELELRVIERTAELEATSKELEAFSYSVSHDLRAPLRHLSGFAELLQKSASSTLDEKSHRYLMAISESANRMGNLIDDLLAFSRVGRSEMQKTNVSLEQIVKEALHDLENEMNGRNIAWKISPLPEVYGDRSMLRLVLVNLISNSLKFTRTREQAKIEIGCKFDKEDEIVFFIRDNGVGFDMRYVDKLFGVLQRLHNRDEFEG